MCIRIGVGLQLAVEIVEVQQREALPFCASSTGNTAAGERQEEDQAKGGRTRSERPCA